MNCCTTNFTLNTSHSLIHTFSLNSLRSCCSLRVFCNNYFFLLLLSSLLGRGRGDGGYTRQTSYEDTRGEGGAGFGRGSETRRQGWSENRLEYCFTNLFLQSLHSVVMTLKICERRDCSTTWSESILVD